MDDNYLLHSDPRKQVNLLYKDCVHRTPTVLFHSLNFLVGALLGGSSGRIVTPIKWSILVICSCWFESTLLIHTIILTCAGVALNDISKVLCREFEVLVVSHQD